MESNRVLSLDGVLLKPDRERMWVEAKPEFHRMSGIYRAVSSCKALVYLEDEDEFILLGSTFGNRLGRVFRVWSLPQSPTPEELAANPWKEG